LDEQTEMKDFLILSVVAILGVIGVLVIVAGISHGIYYLKTKDALWRVCEKLEKTYPKEYKESYVIDQFKLGKVKVEKGWDHWGTGCCMQDMIYLIFYYPLDDYVNLERRYKAKWILDECSGWFWPPEIVEDGAHIWTIFGNHIKWAGGKSYKWLKRHKKYWKLKRLE